ncbi:MAG: hypothetical protein EPN22_16880 [Nitrospirae bacterium]|nr:MAG: hypothetical protein EPN22_16880 [Nitrospirota bacterium]
MTTTTMEECLNKSCIGCTCTVSASSEKPDVLSGYKTELWDLYAEFLKSVQNCLGDYCDEFITAEAWVTERVVVVRQKAFSFSDCAEDYFDLALVFTVLMDHAISWGYVEASRRLEALAERAKVLNEKMYRKEIGG